MMITKLVVAGMVSVAILAATAPMRGAHAQYPPPNGNCVITTSATTAISGGTVNVTVTVRDSNGNPVAGVPVPLVVSKQPGTGASVSPSGGTTDASGVVNARLTLGTGSGATSVTASPAGATCSATVSAGSEAVASQVALPSTGTGHSTGNPATIAWASLMLVAAGAFVAAAGLRRASKG